MEGPTMSQLTTKQLQAARDWLSECQWADTDPEEFEVMSANDIERGIARYFQGGIPAFAETFNPTAPPPDQAKEATPAIDTHKADRAEAAPARRKQPAGARSLSPDQQNLATEPTPQTNLFGQFQPTPIKGKQMPLFHEPVEVAIPDTRSAIDRRIARKFDEKDTPLMFAEQAARQPPPAPRRLTLPERVERALRERGIPYVAVDESKRALFTSAKLKAFHFVVYAPSSDNWLLSCARPTPDHRRDMEQWERVFGEGFRAIFAADRAAGIAFRTLAGESLKLPGRD